ncbi:uncharacterized protein LOC110020519 [Phalaenopsis equestris]|uniref:uncharacterized protein LOC110020519 n=1 Tax=Phalaenopsis equestris TaxID=78828 RepID=UPI0009E41599|nr:uncharacterized protein LOC110020519 [Phalaenopsis equestris]
METAAKTWLGNRNKVSPLLEGGGSEQIVPYGRSRSREQTIDLSMALAMALSNGGKLQNIEIMGSPNAGRKIVLHMDGGMGSKFPQIGEVVKGVQNLNMILKACSNGFSFSRDFAEIGGELLKGAMDLEESLKMLMKIQNASDYMVGSQKKQQLKLLKGEEEEDETQRTAGSRTKFSFIRERRGAGVSEPKKKSASEDEKSRYLGSNSNGNSSKSSIQFISHVRSISGGSGFKSDAPAVRHGSQELVRLSTNGVSSISKYKDDEKVRIPNIIAKLMGLEELPAPKEAKSNEMRKAPQLKEMSSKLVEIDKDFNMKEVTVIANSTKKMLNPDAQERGMNDIVRNNSRNSKISQNSSPASQDSLKKCIGNSAQMDVNNIDHRSEFTITKQQMKGRNEHITPAVGNSFTDHRNDKGVRKKDETVSREEKTARKQPRTDKISQIGSSVKIENSDHEQKCNMAISDAKYDNVGKMEMIQVEDGSVLKQQRKAQTISVVSNQSHNERYSEQMQHLQVLQTGERIKETNAEKKSGTKGELQPSTANKKLIKKSKDIEKHPNEMRAKKQSGKGVDSNKNDLMSKTGRQSRKENLKIISDGANIRNKNTQNHYRGNNLNEQSLYKRLPLNSDTGLEKRARTSMKAIVMKKPTQIQSVQKVNILKVTEQDIYRRSLVEVTLQKKSLDVSQAMEQRSSILEELEYRWKERNKKVEGVDRDSDTSLELNMRQNIEISLVNLPEDDGNKEITIWNPISGDDTKACTCSSPLTRDTTIEAKMDQSIQEEINVKAEKENSGYQVPERSGITMTDFVDKCSQEDPTQKFQEIRSSYTENGEEDYSRSMQLNSSKSIIHEDPTMVDADQQAVLTKDEGALKKMLITSQNFLSAAQSLFQVNIPVELLQATTAESSDKDARFIIDCGYELLGRKGKREELSCFSRKGSLAPLKRKNLDILIKEVNADLESLKYQINGEGCDDDLAICLNKMIEKDIQNWHPDINCLWDFGWGSNTFVCLEKNEIVMDVEKSVLNGLLNELSRDLLNVSISIV